MTRLLQLILLLIPSISFGQEFLQVDTLTDYPTEINSIVKGEIQRVLQVDFAGDEIGGFIVETKMSKDGRTTKFWLTSDLLLFNRESIYVGNYDFMRFINLDNGQAIQNNTMVQFGL